MNAVMVGTGGIHFLILEPVSSASQQGDRRPGPGVAPSPHRLPPAQANLAPLSPLQVFDFCLSEEDMSALLRLNKNLRLAAFPL